MQLLYLVVGTNIQNHFQAHFLIPTFLRPGLSSTVITDAPEFCWHLAGGDNKASPIGSSRSKGQAGQGRAA